MVEGSIADYFAIANSEYRRVESRETDIGCERPVSRGQQPRPSAKVPKIGSVGNEVGRSKQSGGWLRSSHPLRKRNSSLIESSCAKDVTGLKPVTEAADASVLAW